MNKVGWLVVAALVVVIGGTWYLKEEKKGTYTETTYTGELYKVDFPEPFVTEALVEIQVPQNTQKRIITTLNAKHEYIHRKAREEGAKDPIRDPFELPLREEEITEIFEEIMYDVFVDVMNQNGITNEQQIDQAWEHIQEQKINDYVKSQKKSGKRQGALSTRNY